MHQIHPLGCQQRLLSDIGQASFRVSVLLGGGSMQMFQCLVCRFDSRVKAMELDERPTEQYSDIGGLDKQIEEVKAVIQLWWLSIQWKLRIKDLCPLYRQPPQLSNIL